MSDLTADQEALHQDLFDALRDARLDIDGWINDAELAHLLGAVLPIVTAREAALREANVDCVVQCLALTDLDVLRERINALADEWDEEARDDGDDEEPISVTLWRNAIQLRGLVSGDNQAVRDGD